MNIVTYPLETRQQLQRYNAFLKEAEVVARGYGVDVNVVLFCIYLLYAPSSDSVRVGNLMTWRSIEDLIYHWAKNEGVNAVNFFANTNATSGIVLRTEEQTNER